MITLEAVMTLFALTIMAGVISAVIELGFIRRSDNATQKGNARPDRTSG
jgi:hypothetical protein